MTFWLIFLVIVGFRKPFKLAAMLVYHQSAPIWRHHTIYCTHSRLYFSWKLSYLVKIWSSCEIFSPLSEKHNFNFGKPLKNKSLFRCKPSHSPLGVHPILIFSWNLTWDTLVGQWILSLKGPQTLETDVKLTALQWRYNFKKQTCFVGDWVENIGRDSMGRRCKMKLLKVGSEVFQFSENKKFPLAQFLTRAMIANHQDLA